MKQFKLYIMLENDAFSDDPVPEIERILRKLAEDLSLGDSYHLKNYQNLLDINGNIVGGYAIKDSKV